jgi:hypothetical protein
MPVSRQDRFVVTPQRELFEILTEERPAVSPRSSQKLSVMDPAAGDSQSLAVHSCASTAGWKHCRANCECFVLTPPQGSWRLGHPFQAKDARSLLLAQSVQIDVPLTGCAVINGELGAPRSSRVRRENQLHGARSLRAQARRAVAGQLEVLAARPRDGNACQVQGHWSRVSHHDCGWGAAVADGHAAKGDATCQLPARQRHRGQNYGYSA